MYVPTKRASRVAWSRGEKVRMTIDKAALGRRWSQRVEMRALGARYASVPTSPDPRKRLDATPFRAGSAKPGLFEAPARTWATCARVTFF